MSYIQHQNFSVDGFDNDTIYPLRYRTSYFSGSDPTFLVPTNPTFPNSRAGTPTRYIYFFPGQIYNENLITYPVALRDITTSTTLTRITGSTPGNNEYRIVTSTSSNAKTMIEFNVAQAGDEIAYDLYLYNGSLTIEESNYLRIKNLEIENFLPSHILLQDKKASSTNGGTATAGAWYPRDINTEVYDNNNHCSFIQSLNYDNESGTFTEGLTVTGGTSGTTAVIYKLVDNGTDGTLYLTSVSGSGFQNNEQITDTSTGDALVNGTIMDKAFILDAGTYKINALSKFHKCNYTKMRLFNITTSSTIAYSNSITTASTDNTDTDAYLNYIFTVSSGDIIELQYKCQATSSTVGLGYAVSYGDEIYTQIELLKLA